MKKFKSISKKQIKINNLLNKLIIFISILLIFSLLLRKVNVNDNAIKSMIKSYFNITFEESSVAMNPVKENFSPVVYIYNTHNRENYVNLSFNLDFNISYTKLMLSNYLKDLGIDSLISDYKGNSYDESRKVMEKDYQKYHSLTYFIDLHRDAGTHSFTTTTLNGKDYAKILFVLGLENENYLENKKIMTRLNNELSDISRGILEKSGPNVNGIYNQDFNKNTFLIEIGGEENNIEEVSNTLKKVAMALKKIIMEDQNGKKEN